MRQLSFFVDETIFFFFLLYLGEVGRERGEGHSQQPNRISTREGHLVLPQGPQRGTCYEDTDAWF